jgi:septal ring factor EnvC (AmiA/AmiB activator)
MLSLKKLIPLTVSLCVMVPMAASAATAAPNDNARTPYASQIKQEKQMIKTNRETNTALKIAIKDKTQKMKTILKEDKNNKTLVKAEKEAVKQDRENLKNINASLKAAREKAKTDRTNKDCGKLETDLNAVTTLQVSKTSMLQKLSDDLDAVLNMLNGQNAVNQ